LSILQTTHPKLKTLIKITLFSPFIVKTPKRKKSYEAKMRCRLLVILRLLSIASLLLIVGELLEWLIPLAVNNLLVASHNLRALLHDIQALIRASTHRKDASEHLQKAIVGVGGRRGTTVAGSARRSSKRTSTRSPRILRHCGVKRIMS
jgi:hypothetical protein